MNNKTPFESSRSGVEAKIFSASKNTIVQCPSCLTRYAVESGNLSQVDSPKFHCSRCDHLFGAEDAGHFYSGSTKPAAQAETPSGRFTEYDLQGRRLPPTEIREVTVDLDVPSFRGERKNHALQIPRAIGGEYRPSAPHENLRSLPPEILTAETDEQIHFDFEYKKTSSQSDQPESSRNFRGFSLRDASYSGQDLTPADFGKVHYDFAKPESPWTTTETVSQRETAATEAFPPPPATSSSEPVSAWRPIAVFGVPMLVTLCLLALLGAWLSSGANGSNPVSALLSPYLYQSSPSRLSIRDAGFKRVTLEDGDNINLVTGVLSNNTDEPLSQVTLEGFAFDSKGRAIVAQKFAANGDLAKTRIKSLSLDMIKNLQNSSASKPAVLKPGDKLEFNLALLADAGDINTEKLLSRARYFGARVYSVNK